MSQNEINDDDDMLTLSDIEDARKRIANSIKLTPLVRSEVFTKVLPNVRLFFKMESLQRTGAFKERGACNKIYCLTDEEKKRGVIAASAGNHAQGVAYHAGLLGVVATIVMPLSTPLIKISNTQSYGANVILHGSSFDEAYAEARRLQKEKGLVFVHPFDDYEVMAGQGTIGLELLEQNPYLDTVVVPIGGGGLIAGIAVALKEVKPHIRVVGVQPEVLPSMKVGLEKKKPFIVPAATTLADGLAVRETGSLTLKVCQKYVDEVVLVTEGEIANAVLQLLEKEKIVVEGAGAAALAAVLSGKVNCGKQVCCVVGGGNIDVTVLSKIIERGLVEDKRLATFSVRVPDAPGSLSALTAAISGQKANIVEIHHNRGFSKQLGETDVKVTAEVRGNDHLIAVRKALRDSGFGVSEE